MFAATNSFHTTGTEARKVRVEADIRKGLPSFTIVGLGDHAVRESRERVRAAIVNSGFEFPQRRITINIVPAVENNPAFDLAVAVAILAASGQVAAVDQDCAFYAELGLDGATRPVRSSISAAEACDLSLISTIVVAAASAAEAALCHDVNVIALSHLSELANYRDHVVTQTTALSRADGPDIADLRGHRQAIAALEVAAAGGHNVFIVGEPGSGKTMLARRLSSILPALTTSEARDVVRVQSAAGFHLTDASEVRRPFRAPHHSVTAAGLRGGGRIAIPGEIALANHGVLFLDEVTSFAPRSIGTVLQAVEERECVVIRRDGDITYPANFLLVAAVSPCSCALGSAACNCSDPERTAHRYSAMSVMQRCDIVVDVRRPTAEDVRSPAFATSDEIRARVEPARAVQYERYLNERSSTNGAQSACDTRLLIRIGDELRGLLGDKYRRGELSIRRLDATLRVARTIADLRHSGDVALADVKRALTLTQPSLFGLSACDEPLTGAVGR